MDILGLGIVILVLGSLLGLGSRGGGFMLLAGLGILLGVAAFIGFLVTLMLGLL